MLCPHLLVNWARALEANLVRQRHQPPSSKNSNPPAARCGNLWPRNTIGPYSDNDRWEQTSKKKAAAWWTAVSERRLPRRFPRSPPRPVFFSLSTPIPPKTRDRKALE